MRYAAGLLLIVVFLLPACHEKNVGPESHPALKTVSGTMTYRERLALTNRAIAEISLQDVSIADAPARVIAEQQIQDPGQVPIRFSLTYSPEEIDPRRAYTIRAKIFDRGRLIFINDTHTPVLTRGAGNTVKIHLVAVPGPKIGVDPDDTGEADH